MKWLKELKRRITKKQWGGSIKNPTIKIDYIEMTGDLNYPQFIFHFEDAGTKK